uniref:RNA-directed DNA polymerase n=1 Tax=Musca domestica TaxID=7370 RepID=A0A1I8M4C5_MUSDO
MADDLESLPLINQTARELHRRLDLTENTRDPPQLPPINPRMACRRCGKEGHFAARCRYEPILFCWKFGRRNIRTIDCCRKNSGNASRGHGPSDNPRAPQLNTAVHVEPTRLVANIGIGKQRVAATVDTGATSSFIGENLVPRLGDDIRRIPFNANVALADGSQREVPHAVETTIDLGNQIVPIRLLVMPDVSEDIIIGLDFSAKIGARMTLAGLSCIFSSKEHIAAERQRQILDQVDLNRSPAAEVIEISDEEPTTPPRPRRVPSNPPTPPPTVSPLPSVIVLDDDSEDEAPVTSNSSPYRRNANVGTAPQPAPSATERPRGESSEEEALGIMFSPPRVATSPRYADSTQSEPEENGSRLIPTRDEVEASRLRSVVVVPEARPYPFEFAYRLRESKNVSNIGLKDCYWQIPLEEQSKKFTAFTVARRGLFQWRVMRFGLHSASATFQRALDSVIGPVLEPFAFSYLDDIMMIGRTLDEHLANFQEAFHRLRSANLRINSDKCQFFQKETKYLGHVVCDAGIQTDPDKVTAIMEMKPPENVKELRRFLGVVSWYHRFVPEFATLANPLTSLLKKGKHWRWTVKIGRDRE